MQAAASISTAEKPKSALLDIARMQGQRRARLAGILGQDGLDGVVLLGHANLQYVGVSQACCDAGRMHHESIVAVFPARGGPPVVWTDFPEALAADIPAANRFPALSLEYDEGIPALAAAIRSVLPDARRVGFDEFSGPMQARLPGLLQGIEICNGGPSLARARLIKTPDEVECIRHAEGINEMAIEDVYRALRPGVRQNELSAIFMRRAFELGADANTVDPIWNISPRVRSSAPFTVNGEVAFPMSSSDVFLREGDLVLSDTGLCWNGYHSDFGKTWICSDDPRPDPELRRCFDTWSEVIAAVYGKIRPGATLAELIGAAAAVEKKHTFKHFYLGHGIGLSAAEQPFIGVADRLPADDTFALAAGMVFVLEPVIWREGIGGFRSEELVHVTPDGFERLTTFGYEPFQ